MSAQSTLIEAHIQLLLQEDLPVLSVSESIQPLLGYDQQQILSGRPRLQDRIHPDDRDIAEILFAPVREKSAGAINMRVRHADGRIRCIRGEYSKQPAEAGDAVLLDLRLQDAKSLARTLSDVMASPNLRAMMKNTDDYIYFKDRNHVFTGASQTLVSLCSPAESWTDLLGQTDYDLFPEEFADIYYRLEKQVYAGSPVAQAIQETLTKDGRRGWVDNRKYPIHDEAGEIIGLYGVARDITELKQAEMHLFESEERLRLALGAAHQGWFDLDVRTGAVTLAPEYPRLLGYDAGEFDSNLQNWVDNLHPDDRSAVLASYQTMLTSDQTTNLVYRRRHRNGDWVWIESVGKIIERDPGGAALRAIGIHMDITERKKAEDELRKMATTDFLTGLASRRSFISRLDDELARLHRAIDSPVSVLMIDVDKFKQINDRYGHSIGDAVLRHFAELVSENLRQTDMAGRLGGEEFGIVLPGADVDSAMHYAERLRQRVANLPLVKGDTCIAFTVSIGVTQLVASDANPDAALARVDIALYRAKEFGRNRVEVVLAEPNTA